MLLRSVASLVTLATAVFAAASWTETVYTITQLSNKVAYYPGFQSNESKYYTWSYSVLNWSKVTGSETTAPSWRSEFTPLRPTNQWLTGQSFNVYIQDGTSIWGKETYYTKTGTNTFVNGQDSASRSLDEKISTELWYFLQAPGQQPPGEQL